MHRRRSFLIKSLENTLAKLLKSLDFYDADARHKVAIGEMPAVKIAFLLVLATSVAALPMMLCMAVKFQIYMCLASSALSGVLALLTW